MKTWKVGLVLAGLGLLVASCGGRDKDKAKATEKAKEVSVGARAEAAQNFNEAEFATQIRDHARAEGLLARAVELDSEVPNYWLQLGATRKRLGNLTGARQAYERARDLLEGIYQRDPTSPSPLFAEMEVSLLLGQPEEAKHVLQRMVKAHPNDHEVKNFVERHTLDAMRAAPAIKEMTL